MGHPYCKGTPYDNFEDSINLAEKLIAAKAEVKFLKSLRREK